MPATTRSGRVRAARLTDLAAVGELSRLAHPTIEILVAMTPAGTAAAGPLARPSARWACR